MSLVLQGRLVRENLRKRSFSSTSFSSVSSGTMMVMMGILLVLFPIPSTFAKVVVAPRHCPEGSARHLHLAVGKDPTTQMTISFASEWSDPIKDYRGHEVEAIPPLGGIFFGTSPTNLEHFVGETEYPDSYVSTLHRHEEQKYYSPFQHHITIDGLQPSTTYYYVAVLGDREDGMEILSSQRGKHHSHIPTTLDAETKEHLHQTVVENTAAEAKIMHSRDQAKNHGEENNLRRQRRRNLGPPPYDGHEHPCIRASQVRSFKTAPAVGTHQATYATFAIVGDLGQFSHSQDTMEHMSTHQGEYDIALLVGDIAYPEYDHRRWDTFFDFLDDFSPFDQLPLHIATGNHDIDKQEHGNEIFQSYETRFRMPQVFPPEIGTFDGPDGLLNLDAPPYPLPYEWGNAYYAFDYGPAKHIVLSAYSSMEPSSPQYGWFLSELKRVNRTETPWLLVTIHTPLYSTFDKHHHDLQIKAAREHMEPLFVEYYVNVIFTGHIHAYQRTHNVALDVLEETGPLHITVGAGGRNCDAPFMTEEPEPWIAHRDASHYGYGTFQIFNSTVAEWHWVRLKAAEDHGYNTIKGDKTLQLPPLRHDTYTVKNQYFLSHP